MFQPALPFPRRGIRPSTSPPSTPPAATKRRLFHRTVRFSISASVARRLAYDIYTASRASASTGTPTADFDGDGRAPISAFFARRTELGMFWKAARTYFRVQPFGANGDKITPGDYDGDGRTDLAVFRPSTGTWWIHAKLGQFVFDDAVGLGDR